MEFEIRIILILSLFTAMSCKFNASPYATNTPKIRLNHVNLNLIKNEETVSGPNFKVAFIADTHNYYDELSKLIKKINKNGPYSFVVVAGDITNYGLLDEYDETRQYLNKLIFPYLVVIGNHDLLSNGEIIFNRMFGSEQFSLVYKNVHFIFFNNNNWESTGTIPDKPWVESALMASTSPFKVLVAHVSPQDKERFSDQSMSEWETLLTTYGVDYFFNGHAHNSIENEFGSTRRITIGAPSKGYYYELLVTSGGISHKKVPF